MAEIDEHAYKKQDYIKNRDFDDEYYKKLIFQYLKQYKQASSSDIFILLEDKLSDVLIRDQEKRKTKYQYLLDDKYVELDGKTGAVIWKLNDKK